MEGTKFYFIARTFLVEIGIEYLENAFSVFWMQDLFEGLDVVSNLCIAIAQDLFPTRRKVSIACEDIPIPNPIIGSGYCKSKSFFTLLKCRFCFLRRRTR